jgi:hypothetical protein
MDQENNDSNKMNLPKHNLALKSNMSNNTTRVLNTTMAYGKGGAGVGGFQNDQTRILMTSEHSSFHKVLVNNNIKEKHLLKLLSD